MFVFQAAQGSCHRRATRCRCPARQAPSTISWRLGVFGPRPQTTARHGATTPKGDALRKIVLSDQHVTGVRSNKRPEATQQSTTHRGRKQNRFKTTVRYSLSSRPTPPSPTISKSNAICSLAVRTRSAGPRGGSGTDGATRHAPFGFAHLPKRRKLIRKSGGMTTRRQRPRWVAGRQGFEPWDGSHHQRFSRPPHSTTLPPPRTGVRCRGV